jgi:hypothetical protein
MWVVMGALKNEQNRFNIDYNLVVQGVGDNLKIVDQEHNET